MTFSFSRNNKKSFIFSAIKVVALLTFLLSFSLTAYAAGPTININANGSSGTVSITQGTNFTISWTSTNATICTMDKDGNSIGGVSLVGSIGPIDPTHPYYPQTGSSTTFTVNCTDGTNNVSNSVIVSIVAPLPTLNTPVLSASTGNQCGGKINLSFSAVSGATLYNINRDGSQIAQTTGTTFIDSGLVAGSSHTYVVFATNGTNTSLSSNQASANASIGCTASSTTTVFNSDPLDFATVRVSNFTQNPFSISNWTSNVNANPGDIVAVGIYYHNSGPVDALNTTISISVPTGVSQSNFSISGGVSADNATAVSGSATIVLPSNQTLSYIAGSAKWYPNQTQDPNLGVSLPDYSSNNIGTIAPGFPSQGMVIAQFLVSNSSGTNTPTTLLPPTLTATTSAQCGGNINLSWNATSGATAYKIFRNNVQIATTGNLSFTDSGLTPNQTYSYTIVASNSSVNSLPSNQISVNASGTCGGGPGTPQPPTGVTAITSSNCGGEIIISWNSVASSTGYKIFRDGVQIATTSATSFVNSGLLPSSSHSYSIVAFNAQGDSLPSAFASTNASSQCSGPFAGPPLSGATGACGGQIVLSWDQISGASSFKVFRSTGGGGFVQVGTTTNLSFTDPGLTPNTTYQYYVIAVVGGVDSSPSITVSVVSSAQCSTPPTAPTLTGSTSSTCGGLLNLSWTMSPNANYYEIYRNGTFLASTTNLSFTDIVAPSTAFTYAVRVVNNFGFSPNSVTVTITSSAICGGGGGGSPSVTLVANPNAISANATTTLTWTSVNTTSCSAINGWTLITSTNGSQIVTVATTTTFGITCTGAGGTATATTTVTIVPAVIPLAPANLVATTGTQCGGKIDLSWSASIGATSYEIYRGSTLIATTSVTSFTDTAPSVGNPFTYTVRAVNVLGISVDSNQATALSSQPCSTGGGGGVVGGTFNGGRAVFVSPVPIGQIVSGGASPGFQCEYLRDYLRIDFQNNPAEVIKLQIFLKNIEGENNLAITGVFDQATFDAVSRFQTKYQGDVLTPWGYAQGESTGYVYILTKKKINEIVCNQLLSLSQGQQNEIDVFRALQDSLRQHGISVPGIVSKETPAPENVLAINATETPGIISRITNNPNVKNVASAIFAGPQGLRGTLRAIFTFLLILIAAYVLAEELIKRFFKTSDKNSERLRRLAIVVSFLIASIIVSAILKYFVIILPTAILIVLLVAFALWVITKKGNSSNNKMKGFSVISPSAIITPPSSN